MSKRNIIKDFRDAIMDPERNFSERLFLLLTFIAEVTVTIALIGDIITRENIREIVLIVGVMIYVPVVSIVCFYRNKLKFAIGSVAAGLVFLVVPGLFFLGGGVEGGGFIWIVFTFLYVGLVISGKWRIILFSVLFVVSFICYTISYYYPRLASVHSRKMFFADSFISIILVGVLCFVMTWAQNRMYIDENKRAKNEAEKAEELTRAQNRFFSSMSHEIRTPINSILGLNELILRDESANEEIVRDASGIQGAGKMLLALINDILDFSKMEAGSMDIVPVDYRVSDMLSEIVNMIWIKAHDKGLRFDVSVDPKVPSVLYGDEVRIKQILINILNNAIKYTTEGSVSLHIENEMADDKTALLNISVTDTGMGIKKEALPNLFDAFKRVDEEKNRYIEGTGLGLSIVKQLVELMEGTISVNSVYGEGSTFTVTIRQGISDATSIGELNIKNIQTGRKEKYESSFKAPDARILIVDDNEMNLEVERKLLSDTEIIVDTAVNGKVALDLSVMVRYDVILMDHLMPEMDGIECLGKLRSQEGGLNRSTPVIVFTANAGSSNRDLYTRAGFDGYLVKPVSGAVLEDMLIKHISKDKLILTGKSVQMREDINTALGYARKTPVIITTTSMSDIPDRIIKKLRLPILPFLIQTEEGVFKDGVQMSSRELIRYLNSGRNATSSPPSVGAYTDFFADTLKRAHHLIHISITTSMSADYDRACEAAKSFDNVSIVNSECLSSATGILVLIAYRLAQQGVSAEDIVKELETAKKRLKCSFIIDTTDYMAKKGLIGTRIHRIAKSFNLHPSLKFKDDVSGRGRIHLGSTTRAYRKYISDAFPVDIIPDSDVCFVTYADVPQETLKWIGEEISKTAYFENIVFQPASAAISSNCGPGAFGILYFVKSNKSYNLGTLFETIKDDGIDEPEEETASDKKEVATAESTNKPAEEEKWYEKIEFIDADVALQNSGSEDAFKSVLKIFYESAPVKSGELNGFYENENWKDYTIKIHALKSSAKLIGALELSDKALALEMAGKEDNTAFIKNNHDSFMKDYIALVEQLKESVFPEEEADTEENPDKPLADKCLIETVYEEIKKAAENMDCDTIEEVLRELEDYRLPESEKDKIKEIKDKLDAFDYEGISGLFE